MDDAGPCTDPVHTQFDFWVGEWELTWPAEQTGGTPGGRSSGTNRVERVLGGCVIEERFSTSDGSFRGRSLSVHDERSGLWRQTWVDSSGAYLAFTGRLEDGRMVLKTEPIEREGEVVVNRMVFRDIEKNSLDWTWQGSRDGGDTWTDLWNIEYKRTAG